MNIREQMMPTLDLICRKRPPGEPVLYGTPFVKECVALLLRNRDNGWIPRLIADLKRIDKER